MAWARAATAPAAEDKPAAVRWEYEAHNVEAASIQAKVSELSMAGWEVIALDHVDSIVEQGMDGKPHVLVARAVLIARRAK